MPKQILTQSISFGESEKEKQMKTMYLWASRLSGMVGVVCILLAVVSDLTLTQFRVLAHTYIDLAAVAFLFGILAHLYYSRD